MGRELDIGFVMKFKTPQTKQGRIRGHTQSRPESGHEPQMWLLFLRKRRNVYNEPCTIHLKLETSAAAQSEVLILLNSIKQH